MSFIRLPFRIPLVVSLVILTVALFTVGAVFAYISTRSGLIAQFDHHLAATAKDFIAETELTSDGRIVSLLHDLDMETFHSRESRIDILYHLRNPEGQTIFRAAALAATNASLPFRPDIGNEMVFETVPLPGAAKGRAVYAAFRPKRKDNLLENDDKKQQSEDSTERNPIEDGGTPFAQETSVYLTIAEDTTELRRTLLALKLPLP